jgi:succinate dehydrogenase/fumarate reductase flavoprotein subunit
VKIETIQIDNITIDVYSLNTVIVGTGCAGFNAADSLHDLGQQDIAIVTEGVNMGTSRNTGSDKQTYYKITLSGDAPDSVEEMAKTYFAGGCMHGDTALIEAALSARCFNKLAGIGVPFPHNKYGEYIGYKTDHDPRQRATSAGPLTSRFMTEKLEKQVASKNIKIFDGFQVIALLTRDGRRQTADGSREPVAVGLLAIDLSKTDDANYGFTLFNCTNIIWAVGGPAGMYADSVYPESQTGTSGMAYEAGAKGINLTESQYGLASIQFRWNVSGTYQQVIPRYISTGKEGHDPQEV